MPSTTRDPGSSRKARRSPNTSATTPRSRRETATTRSTAVRAGSTRDPSGRIPRARSTTTGGRRRAAVRWDALDVARGALVVTFVVTGVAGLLSPDALRPVDWRGLGLLDTLPGVALVLAGAAMGWRHGPGDRWTGRRRWRRGGVLLAVGLAVAAARAGGDPAAIAPEELLRLLAATGAAGVLVRLPGWLLVPVTAGLLAAPATLVGAGPAGRALTQLDPSVAWAAERALGVPTTGVPVVSLLGATGLVLIGYGLGTWVHHRPPGPASGAALLTIALWSGVATLLVGQVRLPVPVLLDLPAALAAVCVASLVVGTCHLAVALTLDRGRSEPVLEALANVGRTAIVPVAAGAAALGLLRSLVPGLGGLPPLAALTAGGLAAAVLIVVARLLTARFGRIAA